MRCLLFFSRNVFFLDFFLFFIIHDFLFYSLFLSLFQIEKGKDQIGSFHAAAKTYSIGFPLPLFLATKFQPIFCIGTNSNITPIKAIYLVGLMHVHFQRGDLSANSHLFYTYSTQRFISLVIWADDDLMDDCFLDDFICQDGNLVGDHFSLNYSCFCVIRVLHNCI